MVVDNKCDICGTVYRPGNGPHVCNVETLVQIIDILRDLLAYEQDLADRLETALRWYANEENYFETADRDAPGELLSTGTVEESVLPDRGERARTAIGWVK